MGERLMAKGIKEIDHGWKRIQKTMLATASVASRVGIQGPEAQEDHGGPSNVMVMASHEFGEGVPERPVFRSVFDKNRKKYQRELKKLGNDMVEGKTTSAAGLTMLGEDYRSDMIDYVRSGKVKPELGPVTQKKRGESGPPLWDTGQMMGALTTVLEK